MICKSLTVLAGAAALSLASVPAVAQEEPGMAELAPLGSMFEVEPLTPEQEARLPLARQIVQKVLPEGAMMDVMGSAFDGMLGPLMELANEDTSTALAGALGYSAEELSLDDAATAEVLGIVDPAWRDRNAAISSMTQTMMSDMMTRMEPVMRDVMGELYAIYFTQDELRDIDAFFDTESGLSFARQSYAMAGDPRIMAAMFADPELIFGSIAQMPVMMEEAMAGIPAARGFSDLSKADKSRLNQLTGLSEQELESAMNAAAAAQGMDF
jgi:hypothetical protein